MPKGTRSACAALAVVAAVGLAGCSSSGKKDPYKTQGPFPTALATVRATPAASRPPVPISSPGDFGGKVTISVSNVSAVKAAGTGPGQIAGAPALAFTFALRNGSGKTIPLDTVNVTAVYGTAATPADPVSGEQAKPFTGQVKSGGSATGVYVFAVPTAQRSHVTVAVSYSATQPTVVFSGPVR